MDIKTILAAGLGTWAFTSALSLAQAQTAAPASAPASAAVPAGDKAAMERALQQADGPRRRILEAARLSEAKPPAPPPARVRESPVTETLILGTLQPAVEAVKVPAAEAVAPVPVLAPVSVMPVPQIAPLPEAPPETLPPPRLVSRVDPDLPPRIFRRIGARPEVVVDLTVNADGSVADASVRSASVAEAAAPVLEAVRQWRYEPQPFARPHTIRLLLSAPGG